MIMNSWKQQYFEILNNSGSELVTEVDLASKREIKFKLLRQLHNDFGKYMNLMQTVPLAAVK
jgi:hypothetical protein